MSSDIVYITLIRERDKVHRYNLVMSTNNDRVKGSKIQEFASPLNDLNGELASFVTNLIEQNAGLALKLEHMDSLMELAEKAVIEAGKEAQGIKSDAENEANDKAADIVARAEGKAKAVEQEVVIKSKEKAEAEAQRILSEARQRSEEDAAAVRKKAEEEALLIRKEAEQLLASRKQTAESPVKVSEELCTGLDSDENIKVASIGIEGENESSELPEPEAATYGQLYVFAGKSVEESSCSKEEWDENGSPASYDDFVDLVLRPPVHLDQMLKVHGHLKRNPGVKVLDLKGSLYGGLWIRFIVHGNISLLSVLESLSEVEKVSYEVTEVGKISLSP